VSSIIITAFGEDVISYMASVGSGYGKGSDWSNFPKFILQIVADLDAAFSNTRRLCGGFKIRVRKFRSIARRSSRALSAENLQSYRYRILVGNSMRWNPMQGLITRLIHDGQ